MTSLLTHPLPVSEKPFGLFSRENLSKVLEPSATLKEHLFEKTFVKLRQLQIIMFII